MNMVSVIIPARNEFLLGRTIDGILESAEGEIEIIAVLDGYWPEPIRDNPRVTLIHHSKPRGQRVSVNEAARIAVGEYILKTDAHSMFDKGFDVKLIQDCEYDWTVIPRMYNLHAFDWVCENGHRFYQDKFRPEGGKCKECEKPVKIEWVWKPRLHKKTDFMYMDKDLKVQYWSRYNKRKEAKGDIVNIMNGVGACWFQHKERFWELGGLDEEHGSWGQVGVEVACKAWLSGGRHVVNRKTWFAHMFRTTKEFTFPYEIKTKQQDKARRYSRDLWLNDKWLLAKRPFKWLLEKFQPIPTWEPVKSEKKTLLSVMIPARNEKYLQRTIDDCLAKLTTDFEIIVGLDGYEPELKKDPRVVLCHSERIGMRPMINKMARMAKGKYLMKLDAHCIVDKEIDTKLIDCCKSGDTVIAMRYELDSKNWKRRERTDCPYRYISHPSADEKGGLRGLAWPQWAKLHKDEQIGETMTISGSNWLMEREQFLNWGGMDEKHGTFGQEGVEIACMTWLSGGRVLVNKDTWYAHWNRGKTCYSLGASEKPKSMKRSIELWMGDNWPLAKKKFQWLIDKFSPIPGWPTPDTTIVLYTDGRVCEPVFQKCLKTIEDSGKPLIVVSQEPIKTIGQNIVVGELPRTYLSMYKQIIAGLKEVKTKYVAFAEHDVLYGPDHFDFVPPRDDTVYYNKNRWILHTEEKIFSYRAGHALSQLIGDTKLLTNIFEEKLTLLTSAEKVEGRFVTSGTKVRKLCEPGFEKESPKKFDYYKSNIPNIDICHGQNFLGKKRVWPKKETYLDFWGESVILVRRLNFGEPKKYRYKPGYKVKVFSVDELYDNYISHADPNKRAPDNPRGAYELMRVFPPFVKSILAGDEYTNEELEKLPYYEYLIKHLHPRLRNPLTGRGKKHVLHLMRSSKRLCKDIRDNGIKTPLDIWMNGNETILQRGARRIVILKHLGQKEVIARRFESKAAYRKRKYPLSIRHGGNIEKLGEEQFAEKWLGATDKYHYHNYLHLYDKHLKDLKLRNILEIGVKKGASLKLWKDAFPKAIVSGIDINDVSGKFIKWGKQYPVEVFNGSPYKELSKNGLNLFVGDQSDTSFLQKVAEYGKFDLIVDDGSHNPDDQLISFNFLWPRISKGGFYVIEDLWTLSRYKYKREPLMEKLKGMVDSICVTEEATSVSFHPNIVFIQKNG